MKHILDWSEARKEWWVTTYDEHGDAKAGRPLSYFLREGNEPTTAKETPMDDTPTRGLTVRAYTFAFNAGYRSRRRYSELDLDDRLRLYLNSGSLKSAAQEQAWLDGNTYGDSGAAEHLKAREAHGGNY